MYMYRVIYDCECSKEFLICEKYSFWYFEFEKFSGNDIEISFL